VSPSASVKSGEEEAELQKSTRRIKNKSPTGSLDGNGGGCSYDGVLVARLPKELKEHNRAPWSSYLIVKVFGRNVGFYLS